MTGERNQLTRTLQMSLIIQKHKIKIIQHLYQTKSIIYQTNNDGDTVRQFFNNKTKIQKTMKMNEAKDRHDSSILIGIEKVLRNVLDFQRKRIVVFMVQL